MSWQSLAEFVLRFQRSAREQSLAVDDDPRKPAGELAAREFGERVVGAPELVNIAALALAMDRLVVHDLRRPVPETVSQTDLHTLPDEPPSLLRRPFLMQVRDHAAEALCASPFDGSHTVGIGGYELDGTWYLVGLSYPDGCVVARWRPQWGGGDLEAGVVREDAGNLVADIDGHEDWGRAAARFVVVLGMLLDASSTPLRTRDAGPQVARRRRGESQPARPWATRRVYLEGIPKGGGGGESDPSGIAPEGRSAEEVPVRGHLKRQPHGPGGKERKWIYVAEHSARRWVAARPVRVVVSKTPRR